VAAKYVARALLAAVAASVLAGCGYSFEAKTPNPCALITAEQLTEILILEFDAGVPKPDYSSAEQSVCQWSRTDDEGQFIQVMVGADAGRFEAEMADADGGTGTTADHEVPGADKAYYGLSGSLIGMVVDGYFVHIANYTAAPGSRLGTTTEVAAIVAGNVPANVPS
jgi:hypothetical protein